MFMRKESSYSFRDDCKVVQPKYRTKRYGYKSFKYIGAKLWNDMPQIFKCQTSLHDFIRMVKSIDMENYFYQFNERL